MTKQIKTTSILNKKNYELLIDTLNKMVNNGLVEIFSVDGETRYKLTGKKAPRSNNGDAARKAWVTRRRMAAELKQKRVNAAKKAVETRRRNMALQKDTVSR